MRLTGPPDFHNHIQCSTSLRFTSLGSILALFISRPGSSKDSNAANSEQASVPVPTSTGVDPLAVPSRGPLGSSDGGPCSSEPHSGPPCAGAPASAARNKLNTAPQRFSVVFAVEMLLRPAGGTACRQPASKCLLGSHRGCRKPSPGARCCRRTPGRSARRSACCRPRSSTPRHWRAE